MILREWLAKGEAQLAAGPHPKRARRDAETLLLHHIGRDRAWLMAHGDEDLAGCRAIGYQALLDRRFQGEPIQYIAGEAEFYGLPFRVRPGALIPRPETEHLVEKAVELARRLHHPRIVDVGTGSGAIAIAIAHTLPHAKVTAIDLAPAAVQIARENALRNNVSVRFIEGDLLAPVLHERVDLVVSNPPYVPQTDAPSLSVEVREYEPHLALFADKDGLGVYRKLIPQAARVLNPGGSLALEIGYGQSEAVSELLRASGFQGIELTPDLQGIPRVVSASRN